MSRSKGPLVQRAEYLLVQLIGGLLKRASPQRVERWSGRIGRFAERMFRHRTRIAYQNIRHVFAEKSEQECRAILTRSWTHFAQTTLEFLRTINEPLEALAARVEVAGWVNYEEAIGRDRGLIVVTAHFGSWEFALSLVSRTDRKVTIVARALDNELLEEKLLRARQRSQVEFVDRRSAARALVRTLEERGIVIVVADQAVRPREGTLVAFLGRPAWTTTAPARLGLKFGAPILCVFCRPAGAHFVLEIEPPVIPERLSPAERNPETITRMINDLISRQILREPELWLWMHNRWKGVAD